MDVLGCFLCLVLFAVLVTLVMLAVRSMRVMPREHVPRPLWPWSITRYNGWNQSIPQHPVAEPFFPRPWAM